MAKANVSTIKARGIAAADALKQAQIKPLVLEAKEPSLSSMATQGMLAVGTLALLAAEILVDPPMFSRPVL